MSIDNDKAMAVLLSSKSLESAKFDRKQLKALIDQAEERGAVGERERQAAEKAAALSWQARSAALETAAFALTAKLCAVPVVKESHGHELIRREQVMELVTQWRMQRDAAPQAETVRPAAADAGGLSAHAEAVQLLGAVFDAWENGVDCREDGDPDGSYMGKCFQLDDEIFKRCCDLLNRENPPRNAPAYSNEDARILRLQLENLLANPAPTPMMPKEVFDAAAVANREAVNKANAALAVVANRPPAVMAVGLPRLKVPSIDDDAFRKLCDAYHCASQDQLEDAYTAIYEHVDEATADLAHAWQDARPAAMGAVDRDAILESAVQAVAERAGDADRMQVIAAFDAIRSLKANRFALPESIQRMRPTASGAMGAAGRQQCGTMSNEDILQMFATCVGNERDDARQCYVSAEQVIDFVRCWIMPALATRPTASGAAALEPVEGDLLPPVGSKVLIHLGRQDEWVEHTVAGYYVWPAHPFQIKEGQKDAHRVFVRVVDAKGYDNARLLSEVRPAATGEKGGAA